MDRDNAFASYTPSRDLGMRGKMQEQGAMEISAPVAFSVARTLNVRLLGREGEKEQTTQSVSGTLEMQVKVMSSDDKVCVLAKFSSHSVEETLCKWLEIAIKTAGLSQEQVEAEARSKVEGVVGRFEILPSSGHGDLLVLRR